MEDALVFVAASRLGEPPLLHRPSKRLHSLTMNKSAKRAVITIKPLDAVNCSPIHDFLPIKDRWQSQSSVQQSGFSIR